MEYRMTHPPREAFDDWLDPTRAVATGDVDLVVWAEGASPYDLNVQGERPNLARDLLIDTAKKKGFDLVVGGGSRTREPDPEMGELHTNIFNSVYWFGPDGTEVGRYDKMVPLPFGEYLPFGRYMPGLADALGIGDFRAGTEPVVFETRYGRAASPICYEAILPSVVRRFEGVQLLITVTNDAWFGDTANPHQHAMLAAVRATELGIPVIRTAYTGISMVVEPHGAILHETRPFQDVSRIVTVRNAHVETLYQRFGDWFVLLCAVGLAGGLGAARLRRTPPAAG
jgi:apolipoprotein N-acyltransferase